MKKFIILAVATICALTGIFAAPSVVRSSIPKVTTAVVSAQKLQQAVTCTGNIQETEKKDIYLDVPVKASNVSVEVGDYVEEGQELAVIDKQGTLQSIQTQSQSVLENYSGGIPQSVINQFAGSSGATYDGAASVSEIPDTITAPASGIVTGLNVSNSALSDPTKAVVTVSKLDRLSVKASINEQNISDIQVGQQAVITGSGFKDKEYTAVVSKIYPSARQVYSGSSTVTVVDVLLNIDNPDEKLKPGLSAKSKIYTSEEKEVLTVPYEAVIQDEQGQEYVYIYSGGSAVKTPIKTGRELDEGFEVIEGLSKGQQVVLGPDALTHDKERVLLAQKEAA